MKTLLKWAVLLIAGMLIYNYFLGSEAEKETSKKVFQEIKDVGKVVKDFVKEEHQRIKDGKFDRVLDRLKDTYRSVEDKLSNMDPELRNEFRELKDKREDLEKKLSDSGNKLEGQEKKDMEDALEELLSKSNDFIEKIQE